MHPLPEDFDASVFAGRRVELVCFSANTLSIHFDQEHMITSDTLVLHECVADGKTLWSERVQVPVAACRLMLLIGPSVTTASVVANDVLLEFEDGQRLRVVDHSPVYESYRIRIGDREIFV